MPNNIMDKLQNDERLAPASRRQFVKCVVDHVYSFDEAKNWQPKVSEMNEELKLQVAFLRENIPTDWKATPSEAVVKAMQATFGLQRQDINHGGSTTSVLKQVWPVLFTPFGIDHHYKLLMGESCQDLAASGFRVLS